MARGRPHKPSDKEELLRHLRLKVRSGTLRQREIARIRLWKEFQIYALTEREMLAVQGRLLKTGAEEVM